MSYSLSISSNSCKLAALWIQHCLTAPSMWSGHPTGMWESSRSPSPFCSMIVPNMGTSIVALRLTWARSHFHVSGAKRPLPANSHGGHMVCSLFRKRDGTYRGTKLCMCFEVKVPHGACVLILDCRLSWKQWISWLVIIASVFWFQLIQSWRVLYRFESPCCCSELHRCFPVFSPCRTAWGAREQHKTANMVRHWTTRCGNSAACLLSGWVAILPWFCYNTTIFSGTYCNALRVLQERWHPDMPWTVQQFVFPANLLSWTLHCDSTGPLANAMTVFALKLFLHVAQLCGYWQVNRWLWSHNGWLHLPYEIRGMLPRLISSR